MIRSAVSIADGRIRAKFDATSYFEQATSRTILEMAHGNWTGIPALDAARHCADHRRFRELKYALDRAFSVPRIEIRAAVHGPDALRWIRLHRADVAARIEADLDQDVCGFSRPDVGPSWDWSPDWPSDYERLDRFEHDAA
ncbi:hypothetical protein BHAOGJBA_4261 [Methylobacterium hispanicum]|uniref:Uncharacterized protein n=1 Tax=Methylobacterium hispanicum TaxID=270350 RepID=A0AAV4ZS28_9HYPH|nr:hypothetical protein [Methylobacterium hispanicum]GJD90719.1 hypothetical protein BHAOGJBA_4261 [Methylobacterium hispanicum]